MPLNPHPNAHPSAGAYTNAFEIAADMDTQAAKSRGKVAETTRHYGMLLQTRIMGNAHGRPGPRRITGDYLRSWSTTVHALGEGVSATVGTDAPQARRLEYGFVGPDRIGRVFNQPPFPHVGPAVDRTLPEYVQALGDIPDLG
jgi:hypothetical protein